MHFRHLLITLLLCSARLNAQVAELYPEQYDCCDGYGRYILEDYPLSLFINKEYPYTSVHFTAVNATIIEQKSPEPSFIKFKPIDTGIVQIRALFTFSDGTHYQQQLEMRCLPEPQLQIAVRYDSIAINGTIALKVISIPDSIDVTDNFDVGYIDVEFYHQEKKLSLGLYVPGFVFNISKDLRFLQDLDNIKIHECKLVTRDTHIPAAIYEEITIPIR